MKLGTITDPGKVFSIIPFLSFLPYFLNRIHTDLKFKEKEFEPVIILKSAPGASQSKKSTTPNSTSLIVPHAVALKNSSLFTTYEKLGNLIGKQLVGQLYAILEYAPPLRYIPGTKISFPLGKLGLKSEPGKVRVFAMVDW